MGVIDPDLDFLTRRRVGPVPFAAALASAESFLSTDEPELRVLVHFEGSLQGAEDAGFRPTAEAGGVASGFVTMSALEQVAAAENVLLVERSRPMVGELDRSVREIGADVLHAATPPCRGAGVLIGIIDSGIDFTHECFRDESGHTRIVALWDQNLCPLASESPPEGFRYGVEYLRNDIEEALRPGFDPFERVRHIPRNNHGTHVTGIAAGNGNVAGVVRGLGGVTVAGEMPAGTYVGVAPEADIAVVAFDAGGEISESAFAVDAIKYLLDKAGERPVVINISQGDYIGPHDGTGGLERYIDAVLQKPGRVIVKSAGNSGNADSHASGTLHTGERITLLLRVPKGDAEQDCIDIWYPGGDSFGFAVKPPRHAASNVILPGDSKVVLDLPNKNQVYIQSISRYPTNRDGRIYVRLMPGGAQHVKEGEWELILIGAEVNDGRFHAWIDRGKRDNEKVPKFHGPFANDKCTISAPGTASRSITVGSHVNHIHVDPADVASVAVVQGLRGTLAPNSGQGPTRDGRTKPELTAPGEAVISALRGEGPLDLYFLLGGTSMAAPHVTGAVALLLQNNPKLTHEDVRNILCKHARNDANTISPVEGWGAGKLDVLASHQSLTKPEEF